MKCLLATTGTTAHFSASHRGRVYTFMRKQIKEGRQIYVVYPLIKESENWIMKIWKKAISKFPWLSRHRYIP